LLDDAAFDDDEDVGRGFDGVAAGAAVGHSPAGTMPAGVTDAKWSGKADARESGRGVRGGLAVVRVRDDLTPVRRFKDER